MAIIEKSIVVSLFCVGLRIISSEGMILYFLRKPFDMLKIRKRNIQRSIEDLERKKVSALDWLNSRSKYSADAKREFNEDAKRCDDEIKKLEKQRNYDWLLYIGNPLILCVTCMASIWTVVFELGYYNTFSLQSVIIAFVVAALNSIIYALYESLT